MARQETIPGLIDLRRERWARRHNGHPAIYKFRGHWTSLLLGCSAAWGHGPGLEVRLAQKQEGYSPEHKRGSNEDKHITPLLESSLKQRDQRQGTTRVNDVVYVYLV